MHLQGNKLNLAIWTIFILFCCTAGFHVRNFICHLGTNLMGVYLAPFYVWLPSAEDHTPMHTSTSMSIEKSHSIKFRCELKS